MKMIVKKLSIFLLVVLLILSLSTCQLAVTRDLENSSSDSLIGVFITTEPLDLYDFEGYINDNIKGFSGGKISAEKSKKYNEKLYAVLQKKELTNAETGEKTTYNEYVFENLEGFPFFTSKIPNENVEGKYTTTLNSYDAISEVNSNFSTSDDENKTTLEGTIYLSPNFKDLVIYTNPVYQSSDGSVYVTSGSGISSGGVHDEGPYMSKKFDTTIEITENGKVKKESFSIELSISTMFIPEKFVILQMDKNNEIITKETIINKNTPKTYKVNDKTEYILVETHKKDTEGKEIINREIFKHETGNLPIFSPTATGVLVKKYITLKW